MCLSNTYKDTHVIHDGQEGAQLQIAGLEERLISLKYICRCTC